MLPDEASTSYSAHSIPKGEAKSSERENESTRSLLCASLEVTIFTPSSLAIAQNCSTGYRNLSLPSSRTRRGLDNPLAFISSAISLSFAHAVFNDRGN